MARISPIRVDSNIEDVARELEVRDPKLIRRGTVSALNKGMTAAWRATLKPAATSIGVAQKYIRQRTKRYRASTRRLIANLQFNPRGLNPLKVGWSVEKADSYYRGPRAPNAKAFVATMRNGSRQVVVRLSKSVSSTPATGPGRRRGRLPIQSIRIFIGKAVIERMNKALADDGAETFEREFRSYLETRLQQGGYSQNMRRIV